MGSPDFCIGLVWFLAVLHRVGLVLSRSAPAFVTFAAATALSCTFLFCLCLPYSSSMLPTPCD